MRAGTTRPGARAYTTITPRLRRPAHRGRGGRGPADSESPSLRLVTRRRDRDIVAAAGGPAARARVRRCGRVSGRRHGRGTGMHSTKLVKLFQLESRLFLLEFVARARARPGAALSGCRPRRTRRHPARAAGHVTAQPASERGFSLSESRVPATEDRLADSESITDDHRVDS